MGPYQYWLENGVKIFSLQFNFLRPSIYDLKTDESDPSFLSIAQKASHHQTYTKFLQYTKPQNYIFVNYKYTSPFTMTNMYTLDHSCITGYLRNYDPIKQYFCLLPYNNTSRPLIVPQEYLIQNPQLAGFLLTGNRSNFLYVEGSTAWLYDCPHFLSPLYKADRCFDRIPIHFKDTLMYVDPITRQTYDYATPITCDNNPRNIIELDPDSDDQDFYILGPEPIKRKPPLMFTPSQIKTTIRLNTFTAQDAGMYSNAELDQFWNRILFSKHSDSTLQLLGKALSYSFISSNTPNYDADSPQDSGNPYNTLRIGLHDKLLNLTPLFTPTWFSDAFIALFGYPCYILTQCGIYFSTFLFVQATLTLIVKLYKQYPLNIILKIILLYLVLLHMVFLMFLHHEWSVIYMRLKTKNPKVHFPNPNL